MNPEAQESAGGSELESDFNWDEYLEENGVLAVPHHAFKHVDHSLQTGLTPGMRLEVCVRSEPDQPYWVATIITTCGQLLLLRYKGYHDDRRADFWCDVMTSDLHPLGWGRQQGRPMRPPCGVRKKHGDWEAVLEEALAQGGSAPAHLLKGAQTGGDPADLFPPGWCVELQDTVDPGVAWGAQVEDNIGGRLCLRYAGTEGLTQSQARRWVFYLDPLLQPPGWAEENSYSLTPPAVLCGLRSESEWEEVRKNIRQPKEEAFNRDFFKDRPVLSPHCFSEGMKLEAVNPAAPFNISPATVTKVLSDKYFLVQMDSLQGDSEGAGPDSSFLCHHGSTGIFPVHWSLKNGVPLSPPPGYQGQDFDWADYLKQCGAEGAPESCFPVEQSDHDFVESMRLEAVNPVSPEYVHVATVTRVRGQHIWLGLEGLKQTLPDVITHVDSLDIFPVSWCESNGYRLQHPSQPTAQKKSRVAVLQPEKQSQLKATPPDAARQQDLSQSESAQGNGKYSCPKIFFNHLCFSGPYLNKGRIAELPQSIGPGNCVLVLKEVLTLLISSAYKPSRVLRELQQDPELRGHGQGETLKAKYKGKSYRATVGISRTADQVAEFCRRTCVRLECCPNLIAPHMVLEHCSENCFLLTKTKYTHYYGKKKTKRIGRPPGGHTNLESSTKQGSRRKKRKPLSVHKKKRLSTSVDSTPACSPLGSGEEEDLDEDYFLSEEDSGSEQQDDSEVSERKSQPASRCPTPTEPRPREGPRQCRKTPHLPSYSDDENQPPSPKSGRVEVQEKLHLDSSPLGWSITDVTRFIRTTDCAPLARIFRDQEIDGQALLLLSLPTVQECMGLKLGPAIKLCHLIERVKLAFYQRFAG
ncbi:scm-like with four MBT domains protein 1 [Coregonus clupeaformis]|uniref:scm-like with four MBT domains protein 1 n=1 Tax=Coregonus clupeaformis TaxID=59861 RepID=UPI001BE0DD57|nr:scm-like with four MBT domains protein 1 [Coregonus clupeaformis]XP_041744143.1 scm-like with four MBT domains protein 1 [Coregonus clupeaformis]